jgi:hypothetical protein
MINWQGNARMNRHATDIAPTQPKQTQPKHRTDGFDGPRNYLTS